jgi:aryl-alcohol dehydrogenase-like predicted oxidoreductase
VEKRRTIQLFAEALEPLANGYDLTVAQLVIAWTLAQPGITFALCGARNPAQATENARAGQAVISEADLAAISGLVDSHLTNFDG